MHTRSWLEGHELIRQMRQAESCASSDHLSRMNVHRCCVSSNTEEQNFPLICAFIAYIAYIACNFWYQQPTSITSGGPMLAVLIVGVLSISLGSLLTARLAQCRMKCEGQRVVQSHHHSELHSDSKVFACKYHVALFKTRLAQSCPTVLSAAWCLIQLLVFAGQ